MPFIDKTYDPLTGMQTEIGFEDGKMLVRYTQRTQEHNEQNAAMRNDDEVTRHGIKNDWWKVASISNADCMRMIVEDGFDPFKANGKELRAFLVRRKDKWGHCLTTRGRF